ncbi:unnamed protein product [Psylliodes chrysocephalus]|uniref:Uncharacterized protein n=1 Tax=Psylliodes chrysocephalus TaxID=3402493 RepID=A0A9P0CIE4_9CUCU|nr:unnamed protein product [Psylliodes chrysocephala]
MTRCRIDNKKYHFDKRQNEIPGTSNARNLDSPSKTDGTSVELDGQDNMLDDDDVQRTKSFRKRKANQKDWKKNIRKRLRQSGKEYKSCRDQAVRARAFRRNCVNCRSKCLDNFSKEEAVLIHNEFWTNTDDAKGHFYNKTTERYRVELQRNRNVRQKTKFFLQVFFHQELGSRRYKSDQNCLFLQQKANGNHKYSQSVPKRKPNRK